MLGIALLAGLATLLAGIAVLDMTPVRRRAKEGWFDYFFRIYLVPGNAIFFSVIGWMLVLGRDDLDFDTASYLIGVLWVAFLTLPAIRKSARNQQSD